MSWFAVLMQNAPNLLGLVLVVICMQVLLHRLEVNLRKEIGDVDRRLSKEIRDVDRRLRKAIRKLSERMSRIEGHLGRSSGYVAEQRPPAPA